jgi:heme-degrading monooxygenase HmoA
MFAREVSFRLKPNTLNDFNQTFQKEIVPLLRKQPGFRDVVALAHDNNTDITAISLWDSKTQAETYSTGAYSTVIKTMEKFLDGTPTVKVSNVLHSTAHKLTAVVAA